MRRARSVPRRIRLIALVLASLLFLGAVMNLVLVAESRPAVEPGLQEGRTWQAGVGVPERSGQFTWTFAVDPQERRIIDLEASFPYSTRVTHAAGRATITHAIAFWVDGVALHRAERTFVAEPPPEGADGVSRTRTQPGDFDTDLRVDRTGRSGPFALLVTWDWNVSLEPGTQAVFHTTVRPVQVTPHDVGGVPGCSGPDCARAVVILALVVQVGTVVWLKGVPYVGPAAQQEEERQRRQATAARVEGERDRTDPADTDAPLRR